MKRIVKDYDERYTEFLEVAQPLFFKKGYEQTSIQDIIKAVGVAKGTFYHYFDSKVDLLEAVVERIFEQTLARIVPIIDDDNRSPIQKLEDFFNEIGQWKVANKTLMIQLAQVIYQDENVLLREKMREESIATGADFLTRIIQQGIETGTFDAEHPYETAELILSTPRRFSETLINALLKEDRSPQILDLLRRQILVYNRSVERMLGMHADTLTLIDFDDLAAWLED